MKWFLIIISLSFGQPPYHIPFTTEQACRDVKAAMLHKIKEEAPIDFKMIVGCFPEGETHGH